MTPDVSYWSSNAALHEDFPSGLSGSRLVETASGAGAGAAAVAATADRHGVVALSTGTTAAGYDGAATSPLSILFGGGQWILEAVVRFPTLSTGAQEYLAHAGFIDTIGGAQTDGAYFEYDRATAGDVWRARTTSLGVSTTTAVSAIVANAWTRLDIVVNDDATQVDFYVDGELVASHTTNIPSGVGRNTGAGLQIVKSVGATARTLECDRLTYVCSFTSGR